MRGPFRRGVDHLRSPEGRKQLRYVAVSAVFVPIGQLTLQLIVASGVIHRSAAATDVIANVVTATLVTPPYYVVNKRFVWRHDRPVNLHREALTFWVLAVAGVVLSSITLALAARWFPTGDRVWRAVRILVASLTGTGVMWVTRYLLADRWLFRVEESAPNHV